MFVKGIAREKGRESEKREREKGKEKGTKVKRGREKD